MDLGTGCGAAENPPPQALTEPARTIHQQIIVPPKSARPGANFTDRVQVSSDILDATTTNFTLSLDSQEASVQSWTVSTGEVVTCVAP